MKTAIFILAAGVLAFPAALAAQDPQHPGVERDASVLDQDIRDIQGPVEIPAPTSSLPWVPLGAGAFVLGAAGFAALRMARRTRTLTAVEAARASFAAARSMIPDDSGREVAYRVSETVRQFIERRLGLPASRETTEEFLRRLGEQTAACSDERRAAFAAFLEACDLAKFSGWQLDRDQMTGLVESGVNLVEAIEKEQAP